jgi:hypothetical protein
MRADDFPFELARRTKTKTGLHKSLPRLKPEMNPRSRFLPCTFIPGKIEAYNKMAAESEDSAADFKGLVNPRPASSR